LYFSQHSADAATAFALVRERILRGTSIGFTPTGRPKQNAGGGYLYDGPILHEWSWVCVPCNSSELVTHTGEAARRMLEAGRAGDARLSEKWKHFIEPLAARPRCRRSYSPHQDPTRQEPDPLAEIKDAVGRVLDFHIPDLDYSRGDPECAERRTSSAVVRAGGVGAGSTCPPAQPHGQSPA
jgi:hypothetical protein